MGNVKRGEDCTKCGKDDWTPNGKYWRCSPCRVAYRKKHYIDNKESISKYNKSWAEENKDKSNLIKRRWRLSNPESSKEAVKVWRENNKDSVRAYCSNRRSRVRKATPNNLHPDYMWIMKEVYIQSRELSEATGIPHQVDHIVPLKGENVCGLHVPWNLQILTAESNMKKSNKFGSRHPT